MRSEHLGKLDKWVLGWQVHLDPHPVEVLAMLHQEGVLPVLALEGVLRVQLQEEVLPVLQLEGALQVQLGLRVVSVA